VRDVAETSWSAISFAARHGAELMRSFATRQPGFDPDVHLQRVGLANQTTMLMSETLKVQEIAAPRDGRSLRRSRPRTRFRAFDTICSATQERQDAVTRDAGRRLAST
jgi:4-hydroxy-3-methylbut-2-enyl diphosphate reductase